ncbi:hypothetical protein, partial [Streptococcus canis]
GRPFFFCSDELVYARKQAFLSKNTKKDKHQIDVCLQSDIYIYIYLQAHDFIRFHFSELVNQVAHFPL